MLLDNYIKISSEEKANVVSHVIALLILLGCIPILLFKAISLGSTSSIVGIGVFSLMILFCYSSSVRYHLANDSSDKYQWRKIDHICIYLLIGGSYTGYIMRFMDTPEGHMFLGLHWLIIIFGILKKIWFTGRFEIISVLSYLFLGWMVVFIYDDIVPQMNDVTYSLFWIGGLIYSFGVIFYTWNKLPYNHFIWHIFVFGGTFCHVLSLWVSL